MPTETTHSSVSDVPAPTARAVTFIDGQNLFRSALESFGHDLPNYDPLRLSQAVCTKNGWLLERACFYTGVPRRDHSEFWHIYWTAKTRSLRRNPLVKVFTRDTQKRDRKICFPLRGETRRANAARFTMLDGMPMPPGTGLFLPEGRAIPGEFWYHTGEEKGIDVRIALDMVHMARVQRYEVAIIFSQDQDLSEAVQEVKEIAREQQRWIDLFSAFPMGAKTKNRDPIGGTKPIHLDQKLYDSCIDPIDYRPKGQGETGRKRH